MLLTFQDEGSSSEQRGLLVGPLGKDKQSGPLPHLFIPLWPSCHMAAILVHLVSPFMCKNFD